MLKSTCNTISVHLIELFNLSLRAHSHPELWKISQVMPLFKKGDKPFNEYYIHVYRLYITKTCLFKYTEKLITEKLQIFRQKIQIFFLFLLKTL